MTNNRRKKTVLLLTYINSHFPELMRVADLLKKSGRYRPVILFVEGYEATGVKKEFVQSCRAKKISLVGLNDRIPLIKRESEISMSLSNSKKFPAPKDFKGKVKHFAKTTPGVKAISFYLYNFFVSLWYYPKTKKEIRTVENFLGRLKPAALILPEDNVSYNTSIFTRWGHRHRVASVVIPFTIANETEAAEHLKDLPEHQVKGGLSRLVSNLFPEWVYRHHDQDLLLMSALKILANKYLGLSPKKPWLINSGNVSAIAVESPFMMNYYEQNGIAKEKLILTGSTSDDPLCANLKDKKKKLASLHRELKIKNKKPMLLCAIPPPWFPRLQCEFDNYKELIDFWISNLAKIKSYNVVITLHPRIDFRELEYIEEYGVKISRRSTAELIPLCSLYLASISATIRWAITCSKPVLNYDVYKYRFDDYETAAGVITFEKKNDFVKYLGRMTGDKRFYARYAQRQRDCMRDWGLLDGKSGERIIRLIDSMIKRG